LFSYLFVKNFYKVKLFILYYIESLTLTLFEYNSQDKSKDQPINSQAEIKPKFKILAILNDNELQANLLANSIENMMISSCAKVKEYFFLDKSLLYKYAANIQEQFAENKSSAFIHIDAKDQIILNADKVDLVMSEYSQQTLKMLETALIDYKLDLSRDIIRIDYSCRLFANHFGNQIKAKYKSNAAKFFCIDEFRPQDIYDYVGIFKSLFKPLALYLN